jgi:F-type H+-transporting ATPase subunit delta
VSISLAAARVYAKALTDIGAADGSLERIADDLHAVRDALAGLDPDVRHFFELPQLPKDQKLRIVDLAFGDKVGRTVLGLVHVLVDKRREALLGTIVEQFDDLLDDRSGRIRAEVVTARPLDAELVDELHRAIEQQTRRQVVLDQVVDPTLLGGIRINLGDLVVDGTLKRSLSDMRRTLASSLP